MIDAVLRSEGVRPTEVVECPLMIGAAGMAHAGVGITFADAFSSQSFLERGLELRNFEPAIVFEYRAIWAEGMRSPFERTAFLNLLRDAAQDIVAQFQKRTASQVP
jgi:DNA-binding transcriptional LysR family regulator